MNDQEYRDNPWECQDLLRRSLEEVAHDVSPSETTAPCSQPPAVPPNRAHITKPATKPLRGAGVADIPGLHSRERNPARLMECFFLPSNSISPQNNFPIFFMEETKARVRTKKLAYVFF